MAELIDVIRMFLHAENGEPIRYHGDFYSIDADIRAPVFGRLDVPILIGAFNKIMVAHRRPRRRRRARARAVHRPLVGRSGRPGTRRGAEAAGRDDATT